MSGRCESGVARPAPLRVPALPIGSANPSIISIGVMALPRVAGGALSWSESAAMASITGCSVTEHPKPATAEHLKSGHGT